MAIRLGDSARPLHRSGFIASPPSN